MNQLVGLHVALHLLHFYLTFNKLLTSLLLQYCHCCDRLVTAVSLVLFVCNSNLICIDRCYNLFYVMLILGLHVQPCKIVVTCTGGACVVGRCLCCLF